MVFIIQPAFALFYGRMAICIEINASVHKYALLNICGIFFVIIPFYPIADKITDLYQIIIARQINMCKKIHLNAYF
jgi:hypothetical protein